jgi:NhaP-type Na+/H+ or K+/H+ antiporter
MLHIFLPPLLFESAFSIKWYVFAKCAPSCLLLAGPGVLISSFFMGVVIKFAFYQSWTFVQSLLLGTILSATDPVAVVALLKELGAKESLSTTIEGESLLNDGTAVVMFVLLLKAAQQGSWDLGAGDTVLAGLWMVLGGVAWGVICGVFSFAFLSRVFNKPAIECTITLAMSYICFFAAEYWLKVSGVLALVALGLAYGYIGATYISPEIEHFMHEFWEFLAFVANTLVFLTTGLILTLKAFSSDQITSLDILILVGIYVAAHIARGLVSVVCWPVISTSGYGMSRAEAVVAWWGGLRGAVGLACALVVALDSQVLESSRHFAHLVLFHTSGIVLMTLCINAVTIKRLLAFFGMDRVPLPKETNFQLAVRKVEKHGHEKFESLRLDPHLKCAIWSEVEEMYRLTVPTVRVNTTNEAAAASPGSTGPTQSGTSFRMVDKKWDRDNYMAMPKLEAPVSTTASTLAHMSSPIKMNSLQKRVGSLGFASGSTSLMLEMNFEEARRRFLMAVIASYHSQFHEGVLSRGTLKLLVASAEVSIDRRSDLQEWDVGGLRDFVHIDSKWNNWLGNNNHTRATTVQHHHNQGGSVGSSPCWWLLGGGMASDVCARLLQGRLCVGASVRAIIATRHW